MSITNLAEWTTRKWAEYCALYSHYTVQEWIEYFADEGYYSEAEWAMWWVRSHPRRTSRL